MKCGSCKGNHDSVAEVRDCYASGEYSEERDAARQLDQMTGQQQNKDEPSDKQVSYALALLREREWRVELDEPDLRRMDRRQVSKLITALRDAPLITIDRDSALDVPAGRYAIQDSIGADTDADGTGDTILFYQVDRPEEGRWAGYTFVNRLYGSPGDFTRTAVRNITERNRIMKILASDPEYHLALFGREVGQCGLCGSPLTNETSRQLGIGPVCRNKKGWAS